MCARACRLSWPLVSPFFALFLLNPAAIRAHDRKVYDLIAEAEAAAEAAAPRGAQPADAEVAESVDLFGATLILKVDGLDRTRPVGQQVDRLPPHLFAGYAGFAAAGEVERGAAAAPAAAAASAPGAAPDAAGRRARGEKFSRSCDFGAFVDAGSIFRPMCGPRFADSAGAGGAGGAGGDGDDDDDGGGDEAPPPSRRRKP
jgi:hypothetical protein